MFLQENPVHDVIFIVSFLGIIITIISIYRYKAKWRYTIAPLTYLINVFAYNFFLHFGIMNEGLAETWSGIVRLHALFLAIAYIVVETIYRGKK